MVPLHFPVSPESHAYLHPLLPAGVARVDALIEKLPTRLHLAALPTFPRIFRVVGLLKVCVEFAPWPNFRLGGAELADFGSVKLGSIYKLNGRHSSKFLSY